MQELNLPGYHFRIKEQDKKKYIFDPVRKKYIVLTPEEWVRQNFVSYLINEKKYPASLIVFEKEFKLHRRSKRGDVVVYKHDGLPGAIIECKAPHVKISQLVFDQINSYNIELKTACLMITNGLEHYCAIIGKPEKKPEFLDHIPDYDELVSFRSIS